MRRPPAMLIAAVLSLAAAAHGQTNPPGASPSRMLEAVADLIDRSRNAMERLEADAAALARPRGLQLLAARGDDPSALVWTAAADVPAWPERVVLLIHGMDEPGGIWDELVPALRDQYTVARFDYPNDQPIGASADLLAGALRTLRAGGVRRVDLVCHSMGGLVARDVLTRQDTYGGRARGHDDLPDAERLILLGTPNAGSPWARLRAVAEIRERFERFVNDPDRDPLHLLGYLADGAGEAGKDLLPGSAYLEELNARPAPTGVAVTAVVGRLAPVKDADLSAIADSWLLVGIVGHQDARKIARSVEELSTDLGDGVVPCASACLPGCQDTVYLDASHRGMIKVFAAERTVRDLVGTAQPTAPAIPVVLDRLARPAALPDPTAR